MSGVETQESGRPANALPSLESLGTDLLETTRRQRRTALVRPFVAAAGFFVVATAEWWWLTPVFMFLLFVAVVTVTHDVVHHSIGLTRRQTDWALFLFGALLFESGHAYRTTHHRHHEVFPGPDDPEGDPARMGALASVLHGPLFLVRLWRWAYDRRKGQPRERAWLRAEALWTCFGCALALGGWWHAPSLAVYALGAFVGSWVYPLLTVHLPHHDYGDTPLEQTSTLRGRIIPAIFLELTYHLEHHLYPKVPSHNLAELSRRLDPYLRAEGVVPRRVI